AEFFFVCTLVSVPMLLLFSREGVLSCDLELCGRQTTVRAKCFLAGTGCSGWRRMNASAMRSVASVGCRFHSCRGESGQLGATASQAVFLMVSPMWFFFDSWHR
ncbi:unnamed protein product, partial [Ectocarpus sp. 13 AM-2016]